MTGSVMLDVKNLKVSFKQDGQLIPAVRGVSFHVDKGETVVRAGDIVIQRGTSHAWSNRSGKPCRVCFVLIDGEFDPALGF